MLMKYYLKIYAFFFISLPAPVFCGSTSPSQNDIEYHINYSISEKNCIEIKGMFKGNEQGKMLLRLPPYGERISLSSPQGMSHKFKDKNLYEIDFVPKENIFFNYYVCDNNKNRNLEHPVIEPELFHFFSDQVLMIPEYDDHEVKKVKFNFDKMAHNLKIISSFSANKKNFEATLPYATLFNSTLAGTTASSIKKIFVHGYPVYVVTNGQWSFFKQEPIYYVEKIINTQRKFWNDYDFPHYVVFLVQAPENLKHARGFHRENMMSAFMPQRADEKKLAKAIMLLSHELFHAWLGISIKIPLPQGNLQWFFEGVNDYYGMDMVIKSGLINKNDFINLTNDLIKDYYIYPFQTFPNKDLIHNFSLLSPANQIMQTRSHLTFLHYFPYHHQNANFTSLDLAVKEIYQKFKGKKASENEIENVFEKHIGKEKWQKIKSHIIFGKKLDIDPQLFSNYALLINKKMKILDQGFDMGTYIKLMKISSIDTNSNAYQAGLRNNQQVTGYFLSFANPDLPSIIEIKKGKGTQLISYYPNQRSEFVPQYELFPEHIKGS